MLVLEIVAMDFCPQLEESAVQFRDGSALSIKAVTWHRSNSSIKEYGRKRAIRRLSFELMRIDAYAPSVYRRSYRDRQRNLESSRPPMEETGIADIKV